MVFFKLLIHSKLLVVKCVRINNFFMHNKYKYFLFLINRYLYYLDNIKLSAHLKNYFMFIFNFLWKFNPFFGVWVGQFSKCAMSTNKCELVNTNVSWSIVLKAKYISFRIYHYWPTHIFYSWSTLHYLLYMGSKISDVDQLTVYADAITHFVDRLTCRFWH